MGSTVRKRIDTLFWAISNRRRFILMERAPSTDVFTKVLQSKREQGGGRS